LKQIPRYIYLLLLLIVFINGGAWLLNQFSAINIRLLDLLVLSLLFSAIAIITLFLFFKGQDRDPEPQTLFSLVSIGLKFLLEMILALLWFIVAKKISFESVLMFFVLYLTLTLFSVLIILKTLRNKSLQKRY